MATYTGTSGNDTFAFSGSDDATFYGGDGDDSFSGGGGNNLIIGDAGNDILKGNGQDDEIYGGLGEDILNGGAGNDTLEGGDQDDRVYGGPGADYLSGDGGADRLFGGSSNDGDTIYGGSENDQLFGLSGDDTLFGGADDDTLLGGEHDDTFFGGDGNDNLLGDTGNDALFGGNDDDRLLGEDGNDTLDGGDGNDYFSAGAGNDTLTLGSGNDLVELVPFDDEILITDFDIGDNDVDGFYNDQLDVSNLQTPGGDPITIADVTPVDIGGGNVRLDFPGNNVSVTLQGVSFSQMSTPAQLYAAGIPCFTAGTLILTPKGQVPVELLRPGDRVLTRDNGIKELAWVGKRTLSTNDLAQNPDLRPIRVERGVFDNDVPLLFSAQHGILRHDAKAKNEYLVRATHLARLRGGGVRVAHGVREVTYVHLLFDQHEVVLSGGLWSESYYPGPQAIKMMNEPELVELKTLFPELFKVGPQGVFGPTARQIPKFRDLSGYETDLFIDT